MSTTGVSGSDSLTDTDGSDKLVGGAGSDTLDGGAGSDFINAGGGNDWIIYDENDYKILGGGGIDTLWFTRGGQSLNLGTQAINGIEALKLDAGNNSIIFSAADIVRVSDTDRIAITGDKSNLVTFSDFASGSWKWDDLGDGRYRYTNGAVTVVADWTVNVGGFSNNATITATGSTAVTEDVLTDGTLKVSGSLTVTDTNAGQTKLLASMLGTLSGQAADGSAALGTLKITAGLTGQYDYTYSVDNSLVQYLDDGKFRVESFTVQAIDGKTETLSFTINGTNDAPTVVAGGSITASISEKAYNDPGANSTIEETVTGSFQVQDVDSTDGLAAVGGSYQMTGKYGAHFGFTVSDWDAATGLRTVHWTYTYTDQQLNPLGSGQTDKDIFTLELTDGTSIITPTVTINLTGAADALPPITAQITESPDGYVTYNDLRLASTGGSFNVGGAASSLSVVASPDNTPYLGNLTAHLNNGSIDWSFSVRERYIDYLTSGEELTQKYTLIWDSQNNALETQQIEIKIYGISDSNEIQLSSTTSNVQLEPSTIYRAALPIYIDFSKSNDSKVYGADSTSNIMYFYGVSRGLFRGGDSADLIYITSTQQDASEFYGDGGDDQFTLKNADLGFAHIWGGPGSDKYSVYANSTSSSTSEVATVEDFDFSPVNSGGDFIDLGSGSIPITKNTALNFIDKGAIATGHPQHLYTLQASTDGTNYLALLNVVGVELPVNDPNVSFIQTLKDNGNLKFSL